MYKKVSIIVITFNAKDDLLECIESLEKQTYVEKEIIIVDDASTDTTLSALEKVQNRTQLSIKVITNERNLGVAGARNVGIQYASGEIIAFTDSDCVVDRNWISELLKGYDHNEVKAVGGAIFDGRITNMWELTSKGHNYVSNIEGDVAYIQGCNMSFDKTVFTKFMFNDEIKYGYEEKLLCDYLINDGNRIYYMPQAVVYHKHRSTMGSLLRRKYLLGISSIWYRKKQKKLFMFKRHIVFLVALFLIPLFFLSKVFLYIFFFLFAVFCSSLIQYEILIGAKSIREIVITLPLLIFVEISHFCGSCVGLVKYRFFKK